MAALLIRVATIAKEFNFESSEKSQAESMGYHLRFKEITRPQSKQTHFYIIFLPYGFFGILFVYTKARLYVFSCFVSATFVADS